jgi:hypothetical protein
MGRSISAASTAIMEYKGIGIAQFLFMGWPDLEEMTHFSRQVLPLIRKQEQATKSDTQPGPMP